MIVDIARAGVQRIQRVAVLVLLTTGLIAASALPSWAGWSEAATVGTTVATATVAPPTSLTSRTTCTTTVATVNLTWKASTAKRVSGYLIRVSFGGGAYQDQATLGPTATSWTGNTDRFYVTNYPITFTVFTLTQYGWTAESAPTARIVC
ncbi:MAG: hypothetical protein JWP33_2219 [Blastococcus sp.]|jgi:hypothetical protein|nr:hypothetical protein [Blastococcus sp.]